MPVTVTEELLEQYMRASLEHVNNYTDASDVDGPYTAQPGGRIGDDGYDYLMAALDMAKLFLELWFDNDVARCQAIFDTRGTFSLYVAEMPLLLADLDIPANEWGDDEQGDVPPPEAIRAPTTEKRKAAQ